MSPDQSRPVQKKVDKKTERPRAAHHTGTTAAETEGGDSHLASAEPAAVAAAPDGLAEGVARSVSGTKSATALQPNPSSPTRASVAAETSAAAFSILSGLVVLVSPVAYPHMTAILRSAGLNRT